MPSLKNILYKLAKKIGLDKSIAYSSGARIVQGFTGVASIFFIATFLTKAEQGFWYTFGSILAIQVFFELGFTSIITQYVAHEASHLTWKDSTHLEGNPTNHSRLAYLLRFSVKWYSVVGIIFFFVLLCVGYWFFNYYSPSDDDISWQTPWILVSITTVINLFISPLMAILMGLDKVKDVMKMRFYQQLIIPGFNWVLLALGCKLYVLGISSIVSLIYVFVYAFTTDLKPILHNLFKIKITEKVSYRKEILPYQWKIALSWVSGYFIFQLFNPVIFATNGAVVAGQMGMTLTVLNGILQLTLSWTSTKVPLWSKYIALKEFSRLNSSYRSVLKNSSTVCLCFLIVFYIIIYILDLYDISYANRFLSLTLIILMGTTIFINNIINIWATYLRCFLKEPFLVQALTIGILSACSTVIFAKYFGVYGVVWGYFMVVTLISMPLSYYIFRTKKREYYEG